MLNILPSSWENVALGVIGALVAPTMTNMGPWDWSRGLEMTEPLNEK